MGARGCESNVLASPPPPSARVQMKSITVVKVQVSPSPISVLATQISLTGR